MDYNQQLMMLGKRCFNVSEQQRKKDITMPHPLTGADITDPWYYFERMYRGFHYDFITKMASWASMPAANKTFAGIEAYATMLCDSKPAITLTPREPTDERIARIAKAGLTYWWEDAGMENTVGVAVKASRIFGIAWFHDYFDKSKDTMVVEAVHPAHVLVDPNCQVDNFDPAWVIYKYRAQYGALKNEFDGGTLADGTVVNFDRFIKNRAWTLDMYDPSLSDTQRWKDPITPTTTINVYELWYKDPEKVVWEDEDKSGLILEKSKLKYPRGRVITMAGGMVIGDKENPYKHGEIPFTPLHAYIVPGRFYGIGDVQMTMNTQVMRNRFAQLIIDQTMKAGGGWMFLGQGSGVKPSQITQGPFNIIPCKDVNQIRTERPPAPSRHVFDFIQVLDMDFDDAMGIHEISRGATLTSHKTAQEISVMAESDRTRVRQASRNLIWSLKRVTRHVMWGLAQYKEGDWFVRIAGQPEQIAMTEDENGEVTQETPTYEETEFSPKMLLANDGESIKFDIVFADDATLPNSQSESFAKVQGLLEMGVITPEDVLRYRLVDIPYAEQILADRERAMAAEQEAQAAQAEQAAAAAVPPTPEMAAPAGGEMPPMPPGGGGVPPELAAMMGGGAPAGPVPPGMEGVPPELAALPPEQLMAMLAAPPGAMGDPLTDILKTTGELTPEDADAANAGALPAVPPGLPEGVPPELLAQLLGGAAVPSAPTPGVNPLEGLVGGAGLPPEGVDPALMQGLQPPTLGMMPQEIQAVVMQLSQQYGIPPEIILQLLFQLLQMTEPEGAMGTGEAPDLMGIGGMPPEMMEAEAMSQMPNPELEGEQGALL